MSELTEAEMRSIAWRKHYLPKAIIKARTKLEKLEREAIECGRPDLVLRADAVNETWDMALRDREVM